MREVMNLPRLSCSVSGGKWELDKISLRECELMKAVLHNMSYMSFLCFSPKSITGNWNAVTPLSIIINSSELNSLSLMLVLQSLSPRNDYNNQTSLGELSELS